MTRKNYIGHARSALAVSFFKSGWLLVAVLPLTQLGGRALFNITAGIFAVWGLLSLWGHHRSLDRATTLLYLAVLGVFLLGIPGAIDPAGGLRIWAGFLAPSLAVLLVQAALWKSPNALDRLLSAIALFGGITLVGLYLQLPYYVFELSGQPFDPKIQLREDLLPFLLPFFLGWIWQHGNGVRRYWSMASVVIAVLAYVVLSEGRAALLGAIIALIVFSRLVLGWRLRWTIALAASALLIAIIANTGPFRRTALDPEHPLNGFTSGRTALWQQALAHPPERPWVGVGLGNGRYATNILGFELNGVHIQVQHLHNFLLDAWYETGLLGVGTLVTFIGAVFWRVARKWNQLSLPDRQKAGVLLAAALAIVAAALLSFSYTSRYFACLFICFGALIYLTADFNKASDGMTKATA